MNPDLQPELPQSTDARKAVSGPYTGADPVYQPELNTSARGPIPGAEFTGLQTPARQQYLLSLRRDSVVNLKGSLDRPLSELYEQVRSVVNTPEHQRIVERAVANLGRRLERLVAEGYVSTDLQADADAEKRRSAFAADIIQLTTDILGRGLEHFKKQESALEKMGKKLLPDEIHFESMFNNRDVTKRPLKSYVEAHFPSDTNPVTLAGELSGIIQRSLESAIVVSGESQRYQGVLEKLVLLKSLGLPYLDEKKGHTEPSQIRGLARCLAVQNLSNQQIQELLTGIEALPRLPLTHDLLHGPKNNLEQRFRRNLALTLAESTQASFEERMAVVKILGRLLKTEDIEVHPMRLDNDRVLFQRLLNAVHSGSMRIAFLSCPDYSGVVEYDHASNRPVFKYDFKDLGEDVGATARKGHALVRAWYRALQEHGIAVSLEHFGATFEVAQGFQSALPGDQGNLSYEDAIKRVQRSGEAIRKLYESDGIPVTSRLSCELLSDEQFCSRRAQVAQEIISESKSDPIKSRLLDVIAHMRRSLYEAWHVPAPEESPVDYEQRLKETIIPQQLAEYRLTAQMLMQDSPDNTLILCYDSPIMWESLVSLPFMFGQGKGAVNYLGA